MSAQAPQRVFFLAFTGLIVFLTAMDWAVGRFSRHTIPRRTMERVCQATGAQVLAMGNSLVGVGFQERSFDAGMGLDERSGSMNVAMGGSSAIEQLLMLRYALRRGMHPRAVLFGFFDFTLTHPLEYSTRDLIGSRAMLYYVDPEYARGYYHLSFHDRAEFEIMRHLEIFADRGTLWERVELFRRSLAQQGMPPEQTKAMGRGVDFAMLEYNSQPAFLAECGRASHNQLIPSVKEIATQARAAGARVYFVEMPMSPAHVRMFYDQAQWSNGYRAHLRQMLGELGASYIDASHWMPDEGAFEDPLHLTYGGAQEFSRRLGQYLAEADTGKRKD